MTTLPVTVAVKGRQSPDRQDHLGRSRCSEVVVRGGVEPPTFRFSGGFARPGESTIDGLNRPNDASEHQDVQH
jgi:hypothetical protein